MRPKEPLSQLRLSILVAFDEVARPRGLDIAPHECPECDYLRKSIGKYTYDEVPDEVVDLHGGDLPLLGPLGLQYYLPAYLVRATRNADCPAIDMLIYHLSPSATDLSERGSYWRDRLGVFSPTQREAVAQFVEWLGTTSVGHEYPEELTRALSVWRGPAA